MPGRRFLRASATAVKRFRTAWTGHMRSMSLHAANKTTRPESRNAGTTKKGGRSRPSSLAPGEPYSVMAATMPAPAAECAKRILLTFKDRLVAVGIGDCDHSVIAATIPAPTVRPPSRMAKRRPCSIAIGAISSTSNFRLSPGITISVPLGSSTVPVTSVVRK